MHDFDKQKILKRYAERVASFGHSAAALGEPKRRQAFYFDVLAQVEGFCPTDSVIDVGCGYGDLGDYLRSRDWQGRYVGIDINPQLIEEGRLRYPDFDLRVQDIQESLPAETFDWCFSCHALTSDTESISFIEHLRQMLELMWRLCRKGLVFNLLSPLADYTNSIHARPTFSVVMEIVCKLTNRFVIRHDYMPYEYAIYAFKDNAIARDLLIFEAQKVHFKQVTSRWSPSSSKKSPEQLK